MSKKRFILFSLFAICSLLQAQTGLSGYGAVGFRWYNRPAVRGYNNATYYEGKIQLDALITDNVAAQWDFRGFSDNRAVEFREFSVSLKYWKPLRVKVGNLRLPFGLEQIIEKEESDMVDRTYIHGKLNEMGYSSRSVSIMLQRKQKEDGENAFPLSYYVAFYKNNSLSYGAIARVEKKFSDVQTGGSVAIQNYYGTTITGAATFNIGYIASEWSSFLELIVAEDPIEEKILKQISGTRRKVVAYGTRSHTTVKFETEGKIIKSIEPYCEFGIFVPNKYYIKTHTLQLISGVNFYFEKNVRFRINGNVLARKTRYNTNYSFYNSTVTTELQVCL